MNRDDFYREKIEEDARDFDEEPVRLSEEFNECPVCSGSGEGRMCTECACTACGGCGVR